MLKDLFTKFTTPNKHTDPLKLNIMDGFVDIKGYKISKSGTKKLIYHDCGDNVVTDWMRHAIMVMLTGCVFSSSGNKTIEQATASGSRGSSKAFSKINETSAYHSAKTSSTNGVNLDGYLVNGSQYFFSNTDIKEKYSRAAESLNNNIYAYFPTKILFGTGKEYSSWDILKSENETANATWYAEMLASYGGTENTAKITFDSNINNICNTFSGSISKNVYSGNGDITKMRTVSDPDNSTNIISSTSTMNKNYGVVGAIKSYYFDSENDSSYLETTITSTGKILKPEHRGVGRPCFIYFNTPQSNNKTIEAWSNSSSEVALSKDNSSSYLNKITFTVTMPAQSAAENAVGMYYPYNGYTLKQMGLYNDALLTTSVDGSEDTDSYPYKNMQHGMLLAIKNITSFQKTADVELKVTWTLTI